MYGNKCPDERGEDDVYGREQVVLDAKLKIGEREIENKIEDKWQSDYCGEFFRVNFVKHCAVGDGNNSVQHRPGRPKDPRRWRPCGID